MKSSSSEPGPKFRVPKMSRSETPSWLLLQDSELIAKDILCYGSQSKRAKSTIHCFGKY